MRESQDIAHASRCCIIAFCASSSYKDAPARLVHPFLALVAVAVAFVLAATYGRDRKHATPVLVLELVVAAIVALVPPLWWAVMDQRVTAAGGPGTTSSPANQALADASGVSGSVRA